MRKLCPSAWSRQQTRRNLTRLEKESIWHSFDLFSASKHPWGNRQLQRCGFITFSRKDPHIYFYSLHHFKVRYPPGILFHSSAHWLPRENFSAEQWCKESGWITRLGAEAELLSFILFFLTILSSAKAIYINKKKFFLFQRIFFKNPLYSTDWFILIVSYFFS